MNRIINKNDCSNEGEMDYSQYLRRKEKLLISAIELLDEYGIAGVTTKEMAKREGISEPAVYRHFDGKVDVLLAMLDKFSSFDKKLNDTVKEQAMRPFDAIRHLCCAYTGYYGSYPQIASLMYSFDLMKYSPEVEEKFKTIFHERKRVLGELVAAAQEDGELDKKADRDVITDMLFGLIWSTTFQWKLENMEFDLSARVSQMLELLLKDASGRTV